jgi:hypothetical protein
LTIKKSLKVGKHNTLSVNTASERTGETRRSREREQERERERVFRETQDPRKRASTGNCG